MQIHRTCVALACCAALCTSHISPSVIDHSTVCGALCACYCLYGRGCHPSPLAHKAGNFAKSFCSLSQSIRYLIKSRHLAPLTSSPAAVQWSPDRGCPSWPLWCNPPITVLQVLRSLSKQQADTSNRLINSYGPANTCVRDAGLACYAGLDSEPKRLGNGNDSTRGPKSLATL